MKMDFDVNSAKYERLQGLLQTVKNRIDKIKNIKLSLEKQVNKEISGYQSNHSESSNVIVNAYHMKMFSVDAKLYLFKDKYNRVANSISETKNIILKDKESFNYSERNDAFYVRDNAFNQHINDSQREAVLDAKREQALVTKVSKKLSSNYKHTLPPSIMRNIVKLNNESEHINNALAEIAALEKELTHDYIQQKQNLLFLEKQSLMNGAQSESVLISEQIAGFKPAYESNASSSIDTPILDQKPISHIKGCIGRTAMCGITH